MPGDSGGANKSSKTAGSQDPNDKIGPSGFGSAGYVTGNQTLSYKIDFENDPSATAPAQQVVVTDQLSSNFDWSTFELGTIGFGDQVIAPPAHSQHYQTSVSMTYNNQTFDVAIEIGLHSNTGQVYAIFQSIDPTTELPPDVLTGFLPPEDGTGRGMGYFTYTLSPIAGLATGTQIRNVAQVTFDMGETIATNQVAEHDPSQGTDPAKETLITIDAGAPASQVNALPAQTSASPIPISWGGSDDTGGSGIATYDVYASDNGGPFVPFVQGTSSTSALFNGVVGHTYGFYSVATDNVGHAQPTPATAQATTTVISVTVASRQLFYADSAYDGYSGIPAIAHDEAIAPDKVALLPGAGENTFANVSGYTNGINGIMIDLTAGGNHAAMKVNAASDFTFKVSGPFASNSPSTWTTLSGANLPSVLVRPAGSTTIGGTLTNDRIELLWPDQKILGTWLEVIVKANADSGLAADDVFFFGSSPGDTGLGNDPDASFVDATDEISARNHQESDLSLGHTYIAAVSNIYDVNKDDQVDATDQIYARNFGNTYGELDYISIPLLGPFVPVSNGAGTAVASALSNKASSFTTTQSVLVWLSDAQRLEGLNGTRAKYFNDLVWELASGDEAILADVDQPDFSGLNDNLLDSLLGDLGLD